MTVSLEYAQRPRLGRAKGGHYESWFLRANHPSEPRAFWIRYTLFVPARDPAQRLGEIWAIYFDGARAQPIAAQQDIPWTQCRLETDGLDVSLGESTLRPGEARGSVRGSAHHLQWQLHYEGGEAPLLLLPAPSYERPFPKAKALVSRPLVRFSGDLMVDGERITIENWAGSENHNWGQRHTDAYAWGQVCGFDNDKDAFLECASARLKLGPFRSPVMTMAVLRYKGEEFKFNRMSRAWRQKADYAPGRWNFTCAQGGLRLRVHIGARAKDTVALRYRNPPGGIKTCLNSKLGQCELVLERSGEPAVQLHSAAGAAFEILTDAPPANGLYAN
jgi:hypothetical protein